MAKKGRPVYVPPSVFEELDNIMKEDKVQSRSDAFKGMVQYSRVGREARRIRDIFGFGFDTDKKKRRKK